MGLTGALQLGFIYALMAMGVFISFRIMNTPDLTADGSFTLGLCVSAVCSLAGHPLAGVLAGLLAGAASGAVTGFLQTKAGVHPILAGILTMTALYSVNLVVMRGSPNISLIGKPTLFSLIQERLSAASAAPPSAGPAALRQAVRLCVTALFAAALAALLAWFFKTGLGLRIRATGNNEKMVRASSINADSMRILALAIANAGIGLSGAVLAQYQGYADINAGAGIVVIGLASVIIGEAAMKSGPWKNAGASILANLLFAAAGAVVYRIIIAAILRFDFFPAYMLKFLSAVIVAIALSAPKIRARLAAGG